MRTRIVSRRRSHWQTTRKAKSIWGKPQFCSAKGPGELQQGLPPRSQGKEEQGFPKVPRIAGRNSPDFPVASQGLRSCASCRRPRFESRQRNPPPDQKIPQGSPMLNEAQLGANWLGRKGHQESPADRRNSPAFPEPRITKTTSPAAVRKEPPPEQRLPQRLPGPSAVSWKEAPTQTKLPRKYRQRNQTPPAHAKRPPLRSPRAPTARQRYPNQSKSKGAPLPNPPPEWSRASPPHQRSAQIGSIALAATTRNKCES